MIYILHGNNVDAAYKGLEAIIDSHKDWERFYAADSITLNLQLYTDDLMSAKKIIIIENFTSIKNLKVENYTRIPQDKMLIMWEKKELSAHQVSKLSKFAKVENFKLPSTLFHFLDSIAKNPQTSITFLNKLQIENTSALTWHLANRFYLLCLAKLNLDEKHAAKIIGRNIAEWQWQKLKDQSASFSLTKLKQLLSASLKIETLIKTGKTDLPETTMVSFMLAKHLAN